MREQIAQLYVRKRTDDKGFEMIKEHMPDVAEEIRVAYLRDGLSFADQILSLLTQNVWVREKCPNPHHLDNIPCPCGTLGTIERRATWEEVQEYLERSIALIEKVKNYHIRNLRIHLIHLLTTPSGGVLFVKENK